MNVKEATDAAPMQHVATQLAATLAPAIMASKEMATPALVQCNNPIHTDKNA